MAGRLKVPLEAMEAISEAVKDGHSVFCLEQLGVSQRVINVLYDSGVRSIGDLVGRSPDDLLGIQNFGELHLRSVAVALSRYHTIEDI